MKVYLSREKPGVYEVYILTEYNLSKVKRETHSSYEDALTAAQYLSVENRAPICDLSKIGE